MAHSAAPRSATLLLLLASLLLACGGLLGAEAQRVRKELRRLSPYEKAAFVRAIRVMFNTPTAVGQAQYGPAYKDFDYFIIKHAVAANDPRGDQGHGAPCFMTFHRSWLLEVEAAVLAVSPSLGALPFWDITRDLRGGDISRTSRDYIFSSNWFGAVDGNPRKRYAVSNGLFAGRKVPIYKPVPGHEATAGIYTGSRRTRRLRSDGNDNSNEFVTRLPARQTVNSYRGTPFFDLFFYTGIQSNELPVNFSAYDYYFCCNAAAVPDWMSWTTCADYTTLTVAGASLQQQIDIFRVTRSPLFHVSPHWLIGGGDEDNAGDFTDASAAPNEFAFFIVHHTNIDRQNMIWQRAVLALDPTAGDRAWGFPQNQAEYPNGWDGCYVDDVVTANFGYTDIIPGAFPANAAGYTHREVLYYTHPARAFYTYDDLSVPANFGKRRALGEDSGFKWPTFNNTRTKETEEEIVKTCKGTTGFKMVDKIFKRAAANAAKAAAEAKAKKP